MTGSRKGPDEVQVAGCEGRRGAIGGGVTSWLFPHGGPALVPWAENGAGAARQYRNPAKRRRKPGGRSGRRRVPCVWSRGGKGERAGDSHLAALAAPGGGGAPTIVVREPRKLGARGCEEGKEEARGRGRESRAPQTQPGSGFPWNGPGAGIFRGTWGAWNGRSKALARSNGRGNAEARYDETALCPHERRGAIIIPASTG